MPDSVRCVVRNARVRANQAEALEDLIQQLFAQRSLAHIPAKDRQWITAELVQSLRRQSDVYRAMSSKTDGPLLFEIGYFRIRDGELDLITDELPRADPEKVTRVLSEFLEPGAQLLFVAEESTVGWTVRGEDDLTPLDDEAQAAIQG